MFSLWNVCGLRRDRVVRLDHFTQQLQRLPLRWRMPVSPGSRTEAYQPRHCTKYRACLGSRQESGHALLCPQQALLPQSALFWRRSERGTQTVRWHGGCQLWVSLGSAMGKDVTCGAIILSSKLKRSKWKGQLYWIWNGQWCINKRAADVLHGMVVSWSKIKNIDILNCVTYMMMMIMMSCNDICTRLLPCLFTLSPQQWWG